MWEVWGCGIKRTRCEGAGKCEVCRSLERGDEGHVGMRVMWG